MLDAIPEDEEVAKEQGSSNGFGRQIKPLVMQLYLLSTFSVIIKKRGIT